MNPYLNRLQPYPFEKLAKLKAGITPPKHLQAISLSIGEPKHAPPAFVLDTLKNNLHEISKYPSTKGSDELRESIAHWCKKRFNLKQLCANSEVLPVNGTREALFSFTQAAIDASREALVLSPNPFYQIYEGAALLAGAQPCFLNCLEENHFIPDYQAVDEAVWKKCQLLFLCTPGNPTGSVTSISQLQSLIALAHKYDFVIASDECYSEIYPDEHNPPAGLLQASELMGNPNFERCVVFHSLSKRSNLPGLRSGFVAGDAKLLAKFLSYRTYHGCAMSLPTQLASIAAWNDESHVLQNRDYYRQKFSMAYDNLKDVYDIQLPDASFYFWLKTQGSDEDFAARLFEQQNITVLPGRYLSQKVNGINPGAGYVRMAMVAEVDECEQAVARLRDFAKNQF